MKQENGFTLVELAIALMVIGLLIGGVLKGQELIENARITATIRQLQAYDAAAMIFRNTYNALPGDMKRPNRIPHCTEDMCAIGGNGNGKIQDTDSSPLRMEMYNFYPHLTKAGMIQGPEGGTVAQFTAVESDMANSAAEYFFPNFPVTQDLLYHIIAYGMIQGFQGHGYVLYTNAKYAENLDMKLDDGLPCTGHVSIDYTGAECGTYADKFIEGDGLTIPAGF